MSDSTNTLAGLLKLNDQNMADIYPTNVLDDAPVLKAAFAVPASQGGTTHKYLRRAAAAGSAFRKIGIGVTNAAEQFDDITCNCEYLDASFFRDVALAQGYRGGISDYIRKETLAALKSAFANAEKAIFANVAGGFNGLLQFADYTIDAAGTFAGQIVSAGGSGGKSCWLIRWAEDGVAIVAGNDGNMELIFNEDNPSIVPVSAKNGTYNAYNVPVGGWFGLQVGSKYDVCRIANLDSTSGHLLNDDLIAAGISRFAASRPPNMIVMNRTLLAELRASRTATTPTGAPAPFPAEAFGIPIVVTDNLATNEAAIGSTTTPTTSTTTA